MRVLMDSITPMQKRVAAYLVLMKDPRPAEFTPLVDVVFRENNLQFRSFVESHLINIVSTTEPETEEYGKISSSIFLCSWKHGSDLFHSVFLVPRLRQKIRDVLQSNEIGPMMEPTKFSRNYKIGSVGGNMIFEGNNYLPKEVMLEMTLKAFGYDIDMLEVNSCLHSTKICFH